MGKLQRDFTQGSIPAHVLIFSLPMFIGNLLQALYNTVDSIWVGRYVGPLGLGAVSISFPLIFALLSLIFGLTMATTTLVAQYRGAGREEMVQKTVITSLIMLASGGVLMSIVGTVLRYPLLRLIQAPPEILDQSASYLGIFMAGVLGMFMYNVLAAILRGLGDSRTPLTSLAIATVINIVLDPLLILGIGPFPKMGVAGAALATILSQFVSAIHLWRWMRRNTGLIPTQRGQWRVDLDIVKSILRIGLPSGIQQTLVSLSLVAVMTAINTHGADVVAAFGAASRLDQFAFMPSMSIGLAVTALVGQNLGAGKVKRVFMTVRWSAAITTAITGLVSAVAILKPSLLIALFTSDGEVLRIGSEYLRIMGLAYIPYALMFVLSGVMRGAGDTVPSMVFTLLTLWLFRVPMVVFLSRTAGPRGIWIGLAVSAALGALLNWIYYLTGRWQRQVVARPMEPAAMLDQ